MQQPTQPNTNDELAGMAAPRRSRWARAGCLAAGLLIWIPVAFLGAEVWARAIRPQGADLAPAVATVETAKDRDLEIYNATESQAPTPPPQVNTDYPDPRSLDTTPLADWERLARRWNSLLLACDGAGDILERFAPGAPPEIVSLSERAQGRDNIREMVDARDEHNLGDAVRQALDEASTSENRYLTAFDLYSRGYMIEISPGVSPFYKFHFHRLPREAQPPELAVAVVLSRFDAGFYRPYAYQDDLYPAYRKSEFWTNGLGLRNVEVVQPKPAGVYRIICIGGSTTGEGPRNDLTYPALLEQALRNRLATNRIEVINAGIDGMNIGGTLALMNRLDPLQPDLYIHYNYPNDVQPVMQKALEEGPLSSPLRAWLSGVAARSLLLSRHARWAVSWARPEKADYRRIVDDELIPQLQHIHERARQAGARFALCTVAYPEIEGRPAPEQEYIRGMFGLPLPMQLQIEDLYLAVDAFNDAVTVYCQATGALLVPTADRIVGGAELFPDLCHLYIPGLQQKAEIIADTIEPMIRESRAAH